MFLAFSSPLVAEEIDFNRDIRPLLSDKCFQCHGPDEQTRESGLRLDTPEGAFEDLGGYAAFAPGDVEASEALDRITSDDPYLRMPPPESNLELLPEEIQKLKQWVREGAAWEGHWSFDPPQPQRPPDVEQAQRVRNPIDRFVLSRLEADGIRPSGDADRTTLLRRVTLDLTGLPPTEEEYQAFLNDSSDDAYEKVVDRLLSSDACAERLTLEWLDLARYADSHGLHADGSRNVWRWRDWVIDAFSRNMPYDRFVTLQIAGDMIEGADLESQIATAFHRNHAMTGEGGVIDEEWRLNGVFDRSETTATAFLGLTIECSRCHDHKFDPLSQKEYYELAAFFNNLRELGMTGDDGDFAPIVSLPTEEQTEQLAGLRQDLSAAEERLAQIRHSARVRFDAGKGDAPAEDAELSGFVPKPDHYYPLEEIAWVEVSNKPQPSAEQAAEQEPASSEGEAEDEGESTTDEPSTPPAAKKVLQIDGAEELQVDVEPDFRPGPSGQAAFLEGEYGYLKLKGIGVIDTAEAFSAALWVFPQEPAGAEDAPKTTRVMLGAAGHKNMFWRGYEFFFDTDDRLALTLVHKVPENQIHIRTREPIPNDAWAHVAFSYDGSATAAGTRLFVNGKPAEVEVLEDTLDRTIYPLRSEEGYPLDHQREMRIGRSHRGFTGDFGVYKGGVDDMRFFDCALTEVEAAAIYASYDEQDASKLLSETGLADKRFEHWLQRDVPEWSGALAEHRKLLAEHVAVLSEVEAIMVMEEMAEPRETYILNRGQYDMPGDAVQPGVPMIAGEMNPGLPRNRLGLAEWLFGNDNPLTARVAVNRYWQMLFGSGLVATAHDFGTQGARPTHPELLDWLALRFRDSGWDLRELLRLMVLSSTYRQSSSIADWRASGTDTEPNPQTIDPENKLLWRGPSQRLPGETIRDSALAASGLLVQRVGGPSVKPYQPEGLWIEKSNFSHDLLRYTPDEGEGLYRRSMYTFIRRTSPPPSMETFDVPNRSRCTVKREVTNTPLQALVLLNDTQYVEAARVLAERVLEQQELGAEEQISQVFGKLTGRPPSEGEIGALDDLYHKCLARYRDEPSTADDLLDVGDTACPEGLDKAALAAMTMVANTVMNYDAFYMKR